MITVKIVMWREKLLAWLRVFERLAFYWIIGGAEMKSRLIIAVAAATCVMGLVVAPASASTVTYGIIFTSTVGGAGGTGSFAVDSSVTPPAPLTAFSATVDGFGFEFANINFSFPTSFTPPSNLTLLANYFTCGFACQLDIGSDSNGPGTWDFLHSACAGCQISEDQGTFTVTPLPAALPLFATCLGALGLLGWRRKRKNAAAIAA